MAYMCDLCSKKNVAGGTHKHHRGIAGGQWRRRAQHTLRTISVNLHFVTLPINGIKTRIRACAKCIKRTRFDNNKLAIASTK